MTSYISNSIRETEYIAQEFIKHVAPRTVVCVHGELGAGKTTFIKAFIEAKTNSSVRVNSPTFQYLNIYPGLPPIYHFDLYRLRSAEEFLHLGFEEFLHAPAITCIEWAERIKELIPHNAIHIMLSYKGETQREITITFPKT